MAITTIQHRPLRRPAPGPVDWNVSFTEEQCDQYGNTPTTVRGLQPTPHRRLFLPAPASSCPSWAQLGSRTAVHRVCMATVAGPGAAAGGGQEERSRHRQCSGRPGPLHLLAPGRPDPGRPGERGDGPAALLSLAALRGAPTAQTGACLRRTSFHKQCLLWSHELLSLQKLPGWIRELAAGQKLQRGAPALLPLPRV